MTQLKRLIDEPGSDLDRVLLEAALDDQPPKASLERTLVALGVGSATAIGAGALGASGAGASLGGAKGLFGASIVKWVGGALIASAAVGGILITQREAQPPQAVVAPHAAVPQEAPEQAAPALVPQADRTAAPRSDLPAEAAPAEAVPGEAVPTEGPKAQALPLDAKPEATLEKSKPAALEPKASEPKAGVEKPQAAKVDKPAPDLTAGGGSLSDELRMLDTARKALLAGDNDACLASLATYSKKFPKGQLVSDAHATKAACAAKKAAAAP